MQSAQTNEEKTKNKLIGLNEWLEPRGTKIEWINVQAFTWHFSINCYELRWHYLYAIRQHCTNRKYALLKLLRACKHLTW